MTWEEYIAEVSKMGHYGFICGKVENAPPDADKQLKAALEAGDRYVQAQREAEAG
jgi:hypothetical protein